MSRAMLAVTVVAVLATAVSTVGAAVVGDSCQTANSTSGICTLLNNCPFILGLIKMKPKPAAVETFLRGSSCGLKMNRVPVVCCPASEQPLESHRNRHLINAEHCGLDVSSKIYGGQEANLGEFPWIAVLEYKVGDSYEDRCGGTLITNKFVLTAAHCLRASLTRVRLGEHDVRSNPDCEEYVGGERICAPPVQTVQVKRAVRHPQYLLDKRTPKIVNDIALLELSTPVVFNEYVRAICLPLEETVLDGKRLKVSGWGATENATTSAVLLKAEVPMVNLAECNRLYASLGVRSPLTTTQLCAGGADAADSCKGDSGGPLQGFAPQGQNMVVYGVVSYGPSRCALPGVPAVYTAVFKYMPWIMDTIT